MWRPHSTPSTIHFFKKRIINHGYNFCFVVLVFQRVSCYVIGWPHTSSAYASLTAGITGVCHCAQLTMLNIFPLLPSFFPSLCFSLSLSFSLFVQFSDILFNFPCMNVCLNRCLCTMCVPGTLAGQKGARALELELVMSHHVGSRSWRKSQYPNL